MTMLKSILSVFKGAAGLILKVMLVLVLIFAAGYCVITMLMEPLIWGGLVRAVIAAACVLVLVWLVRRREDD